MLFVQRALAREPIRVPIESLERRYEVSARWPNSFDRFVSPRFTCDPVAGEGTALSEDTDTRRI